MIRKNDVLKIGAFLKPHGLKGEINAMIEPDIDIEQLRCIVTDIDSILIPFFVTDYRAKGRDSVLLSLEDVDRVESASMLSGKDIFMLKADVSAQTDNGNEDVIYLADLLNFELRDVTGDVIGTISGIDDTTENVILMVSDAQGRNVLVPFAEELICSVDADGRILVMNLPRGLMDLN